VSIVRGGSFGFVSTRIAKLTIWSKIARSDSSNKASNYKAGVLFDIGETTESREHQGSGESRDHLGQEKRRDSKSVRQLSVRLEKNDEKRGIRVYWRQCWRRSSGRKGEDNSEDKKDSRETQAEKLGQVCGHGRRRPSSSLHTSSVLVPYDSTQRAHPVVLPKTIVNFQY
jgi:hypothetical protein